MRKAISNQTIIDARGLAEMFGMSLRSAQRLVDFHPDFPRPIRISPGRRVWMRAEVEEWLLRFAPRVGTSDASALAS